jgi:hypothetical protein
MSNSALERDRLCRFGEGAEDELRLPSEPLRGAKEKKLSWARSWNDA